MQCDLLDHLLSFCVFEFLFFIVFFFNDTATTEIYTSDTLFPYTTLFRSSSPPSSRATKPKPFAALKNLTVPWPSPTTCAGIPPPRPPPKPPPPPRSPPPKPPRSPQIGRASCRERVCQYV